MRFPMMKGSAQYRVEIPQLTGGVNLSDLPTQVEDNQLTDAHNMWWHQGVLRTRPGLKEIGGGDPANNVLNKCRISEREEIVFHVVDGGEDTVTVRADSFSTRGRNEIGMFTTSGADRSALGVHVDDEKPYLIFTGDGKIYSAAESESVTDAEPYVPLVTVERRNEDGSVSNIKFEGYNMLTPQFKCSFSTDGEITTFQLPVKELDVCTATVEMTIAMDGGTQKLTFTITPSNGLSSGFSDIVDITKHSISYDEKYSPSDVHAYSMIDYDRGELQIVARGWCYDTETEISTSYDFPFKAVTTNNIVVTVSKTQEGQRETICRMTRAAWFGGTRSGLDSGTRLFVTGNPDKPHLVHWSDVNNPLYFPESNYFYVGDADQRVTAFGQQGDLLVIFKEHQLYCSQYVAGSAITRDDLISGKVTDIAALTAQFPLTPLHPTIGCDCPDTIRLVNNRLVWVTSDAHVYMLPSVNQYSERNVRDITALIRRNLEKHTADELKAAVATEYKGHYMLILPDGTAYLLDVGNSAFQSYAYYASEKKANRALPWYIWKFGRGGERFWSAVSTGDELHLMANNVTNREYTLEGEDDDSEPITCSFTTKLFDFGRGDKLKAVREMYVRVGGVPNSCVHLSYLFDDFVFEDAYRIEPTEDGELYDAGYIRSYRITPNVNRARLFGLRFDSDGAMAVEGIGLNYSIQGVIR